MVLQGRKRHGEGVARWCVVLLLFIFLIIRTCFVIISPVACSTSCGRAAPYSNIYPYIYIHTNVIFTFSHQGLANTKRNEEGEHPNRLQMAERSWWDDHGFSLTGGTTTTSAPHGCHHPRIPLLIGRSAPWAAPQLDFFRTPSNKIKKREP